MEGREGKGREGWMVMLVREKGMEFLAVRGKDRGRSCVGFDGVVEGIASTWLSINLILAIRSRCVCVCAAMSLMGVIVSKVEYPLGFHIMLF